MFSSTSGLTLGTRMWLQSAAGTPAKLSPRLRLQTFPSVTFFLAQTPPLLSCPAQRGRILLVAMTPAQCVCDMQPLDTSSFKEELLSDADATPADTWTPPAGTGT